MGLRVVFGYVGHEVTMAEALVHVLDHLCTACDNEPDHDYKSCRVCPAGRFIYKCRQYLLEAPAFDHNYLWLDKMEQEEPGRKEHWQFTREHYKKEDALVRELAAAIREVEPEPRFNANWIFQDKWHDRLAQVRLLVKDLELTQRSLHMNLQFESQVRQAVVSELFVRVGPHLKKAGAKKAEGKPEPEVG